MFTRASVYSGAVCKLYFDLEFDRTVNPSVKGDELIETFIKVHCTRNLILSLI